MEWITNSKGGRVGFSVIDEKTKKPSYNVCIEKPSRYYRVCFTVFKKGGKDDMIDGTKYECFLTDLTKAMSVKNRHIMLDILADMKEIGTKQGITKFLNKLNVKFSETCAYLIFVDKTWSELKVAGSSPHDWQMGL